MTQPDHRCNLCDQNIKDRVDRIISGAPSRASGYWQKKAHILHKLYPLIDGMRTTCPNNQVQPGPAHSESKTADTPVNSDPVASIVTH